MGRQSRRAGLLVWFGVVATVAAAQPPLRPISSHRLPKILGDEVRDVAWLDEGSLLLASNRGVFRYVLKTGAVKEVLAGVPVPEGLSEPMAIATDGETLEAVSPYSSGTFALRLKDHKRLLAQQSHKVIASDVAVRGARVCFLGFAGASFGDVTSTTAVFCGGFGDSWAELKPLHTIHAGPAAATIYRASVPPYAGSIVIEPDGVIDVITSAESGVYRYSPAGSVIGVLGSRLNELVLDNAEDIIKQYAVDVDKRYRALLNMRATTDGLVATPDGPAIVVRLAAHDVIHWELWYPEVAGGATRRFGLGIERQGPFGHLRCNTRGDRMACVGSAPDAADAVNPRKSEASPTLWLFRFPRQPR